MKSYQNSYYVAKHLTGGELGDRCETLEEMRESIDKTNAHNKVYGYQQHQYIICLAQWGRIFDDDDMFISENETVTRIEVYPATIPLEFTTK